METTVITTSPQTAVLGSEYDIQTIEKSLTNLDILLG